MFLSQVMVFSRPLTQQAEQFTVNLKSSISSNFQVPKVCVLFLSVSKSLYHPPSFPCSDVTVSAGFLIILYLLYRNRNNLITALLTAPTNHSPSLILLPTSHLNERHSYITFWLTIFQKLLCIWGRKP